MDEYSKSGPKTPQGNVLSRKREVARQMRELLALNDEQTLTDALIRDYGIDEAHPRFKMILKTWRELQQHRS
jgi:hypothetical protein